MAREKERFGIFIWLRGDCVGGWEEATFEQEIPFNNKLASMPFSFAIEKGVEGLY